MAGCEAALGFEYSNARKCQLDTKWLTSIEYDKNTSRGSKMEILLPNICHAVSKCPSLLLAVFVNDMRYSAVPREYMMITIIPATAVNISDLS